MKSITELREMAQQIKAFAVNKKQCSGLNNLFVEDCKDFIFNSNGTACSIRFNNVVIDDVNEYFDSILVFNSNDEKIDEIKLLTQE